MSDIKINTEETIWRVMTEIQSSLAKLITLRDKSTSENNLRMERQALLIGTMLGQISELLNQIKSRDLSKDIIYHSLVDISNMAALQVHEIFYKDKHL